MKEEEDDWQREMIILDELEKTIYQGLLISIYSAYESHIITILNYTKDNKKRPLFDQSSLTKPRDSINVKLKKFLEFTANPNIREFCNNFYSKLVRYTKIRNTIVHNEGTIPKKYEHLKLELTNCGGLWKSILGRYDEIIITREFLEMMICDIEKLFELILYDKTNRLIYD